MNKLIKQFRQDENGAVVIDWLVLTAAVVALAGTVYSALETDFSTLTISTPVFVESSTPATDLADG